MHLDGWHFTSWPLANPIFLKLRGVSLVDLGLGTAHARGTLEHLGQVNDLLILVSLSFCVKVTCKRKHKGPWKHFNSNLSDNKGKACWYWYLAHRTGLIVHRQCHRQLRHPDRGAGGEAASLSPAGLAGFVCSVVILFVSTPYPQPPGPAPTQTLPRYSPVCP